MLGKKYAEKLAKVELGVKKAVVYVNGEPTTVNAEESFFGEDESKGVFIRSLSCIFDAKGKLDIVDFIDEDGNLIWREPFYGKEVDGEYRARVKIEFPYEWE
jgi:hypothetical protein